MNGHEIETSNLIEQSMQLLTERERQVLSYLYGYSDGQVHSFYQASKEFRLTEARLRQIELSAVKKIEQKYGDLFKMLVSENHTLYGEFKLISRVRGLTKQS